MRANEFITEGVAGPKSCWPGHRKVGTQPGTGKNKGKRVNDCEKIKEDDTQQISLGNTLQWPEVVNKVNSAMKAMGWKGQRKDDGAFMFSTKGQETDDQWYMVVIENAGQGHFTYALGTVEEGDPHIGEQDTLPNTEASVSELMNAIREGFGLNEQRIATSADQLFDQIEEMVEALAEAHGVDADVIWEDFDSVDDSELLNEAAAWRTSKGKNKNGGLNAKGVASYRRENPGSKLQTAVTTKPSKLKPGSKAAKRRKSFCARMGGMKGAMKKPNGKPTRKALALRKWNC